MSVAMYSTPATSGSATISFTGMFGRLPVMLVHVLPKSEDLKTCPESSSGTALVPKVRNPLNPDIAAYKVEGSIGSNVTWVTLRPARPADRSDQLVPASLALTVISTLPLLVPNATTCGFAGDTAI